MWRDRSDRPSLSAITPFPEAAGPRHRSEEGGGIPDLLDDEADHAGFGIVGEQLNVVGDVAYRFVPRRDGHPEAQPPLQASCQARAQEEAALGDDRGGARVQFDAAAGEEVGVGPDVEEAAAVGPHHGHLRAGRLDEPVLQSRSPVAQFGVPARRHDHSPATE